MDGGAHRVARHEQGYSMQDRTKDIICLIGIIITLLIPIAIMMIPLFLDPLNPTG